MDNCIKILKVATVDYQQIAMESDNSLWVVFLVILGVSLSALWVHYACIVWTPQTQKEH